MAEPLDTDVAIETPEHIVFRYRLAGPARRALAQLVDLVVCYGTLTVVVVVVGIAIFGASLSAIGEVTSAAKAFGGLVLLGLFAAQWIYFVAWEAKTGRTPGKAALGLRVVTTTGRPIGIRAATLRNLLRSADMLPIAYVTGFVSAALSSRFQRLGDLVAGTMVVVPARTRSADAFELAPPAEPREVATLPDDVVLDAEERGAIELFLRRKATLGRAREQELAEMLARPLSARLGFQHPDPSRLLALVYDRAVNAGRTDAPPSSFRPARRAS